MGASAEIGSLKYIPPWDLLQEVILQCLEESQGGRLALRDLLKKVSEKATQLNEVSGLQVNIGPFKSIMGLLYALEYNGKIRLQHNPDGDITVELVELGEGRKEIHPTRKILATVLSRD